MSSRPLRLGAWLTLAACAGSVGASTLESAILSNAGSERAAYLSRGTGARAAAMGGAWVALADDATALSWNPAGLGKVGSLNAVAMYDVVAAGVGVSALNVADPLGPVVVGGGLTAEQFGGYDVRDLDGNKTGTASLTNFAVEAGVAYRDRERRSSYGLVLEGVREFDGTALVGASGGMMLPVGRDGTFGLAANHLSTHNADFSLPATLQAGAAWRVMPELTVAADYGYPLISQQAWLAAGAELAPTPMFAARVGYRYHLQDQGLGGLAGLTAGVGVRLGSFGLDYAFQPEGDLATSHRVALVYGAPAATAN